LTRSESKLLTFELGAILSAALIGIAPKILVNNIIRIKNIPAAFPNLVLIIGLSFYCSILNTPTVRSRDEVNPASYLLSSKRQGNEVEAGNTPTVRSWEVYCGFISGIVDCGSA
jgi:hypothetical protein